MKISKVVLGSLMLVSTAGTAQICNGCKIQPSENDSVRLEQEYQDMELEQRVLEMGCEKKVKTIHPDGSIEYEYVRKRNYCSKCGMG